MLLLLQLLLLPLLLPLLLLLSAVGAAAALLPLLLHSSWSGTLPELKASLYSLTLADPSPLRPGIQEPLPGGEDRQSFVPLRRWLSQLITVSTVR